MSRVIRSSLSRSRTFGFSTTNSSVTSILNCSLRSLTKAIHTNRVQAVQVSQIQLTSSNRKSSDTYNFYANMSSKHLATGSTLPPAQDGILRIYSMRFCPYAHRALLVADAKNIPHDVVNCNLKQKPEWLLERNPGGKVPVIDTPKGSLYESLIVSDYLDEVHPNHPLNSSDPFQKALDRIWVENFSKTSTLYFKLLASRADLEAAKGIWSDLVDVLVTFEKELERRGTLFFGAQYPGMLDYMIWPWFERLPVLKFVFPSLLEEFENMRKNNPTLEKWRQAMKEDPAVKASFLPGDIHWKFLQTFLDYDADYDILEN